MTKVIYQKTLLRKSFFLLCASVPLCLCASVPLWFKTAVAVDHAAVSKPERGKATLYGFAKNSHLSLGFDPRFAREESGSRRFDSGDIGIGVFHNFNREYESTPALALRADAYLPTNRDSSGVDFRLRAIATKHIFARSQLHLNLHLRIDNSAQNGQRKIQPGIVLGYSQPLGYPSRFDRTLVAQIGYRVNQLHNENGVTTMGLGLRQQVGVQSVFDVGVLSDFTSVSSRERLKIVAGYSRQF